MMSLSAIRSRSRQAAQVAANTHRTPLLVHPDDLLSEAHIRAHLKHTPTLGDYIPEGWKLLDVRSVDPASRYSEFFVDATGMDFSGPAMSQDAFVQKVMLLGPDYAYAISEIGQFQLHVRLYQKG